MNNIVYTTKEVAKLLHYSEDVVRVLAKVLHIPKRAFNYYRFTEKDIETIKKYIKDAEY